MVRILVCILLALALGGLAAQADPSFNSSVALQTIGGADMTKAASRANPVPVELQLGAAGGLAVAPASAAPGFLAVAVGTASKEVLPALASPVRWRFLQNTDAAVGLWCAFGTVATKAAPAIFILPRQAIAFDATAFVPAGAVNCISDAVTGTVAVTAAQATR